MADGLRARGQRLCSVLSSGFKARLHVRWEPCPRLFSVATLGSETASPWPRPSPGEVWSPPTLRCHWASLSFSLFKILSPPFNLLLLLICSLVSDSLRPHGLQHARLPCPSPSPRACSNSCPLSQGCHSTISSSVVPFFSCPQSIHESAFCIWPRWPKY